MSRLAGLVFAVWALHEAWSWVSANWRELAVSSGVSVVDESAVTQLQIFATIQFLEGRRLGL